MPVEEGAGLSLLLQPLALAAQEEVVQRLQILTVIMEL
jgi:hypothetical protein